MMKRHIAATLREHLDQRLPALRAAQSAAQVPSRGWLRAVRQALATSLAEIGRELERAPQNVAEYESTEARDAITLGTLRRCADALGCDLVYYLVPKGDLSFADLAESRDPAEKIRRATEHSMALEDQAVPRRPKRHSAKD